MTVYETTPGECDVSKFKQRYALADEDMSTQLINGFLWLYLREPVKDKPPIFDPPDPPQPLKTREDYAQDVTGFLDTVVPPPRQEAFMDALLKLIGARPPDVKDP